MVVNLRKLALVPSEQRLLLPAWEVICRQGKALLASVHRIGLHGRGIGPEAWERTTLRNLSGTDAAASDTARPR